MAQPLIVFDLDGTLIDTAPDLVGTLNALLEREGLAPVSFEAGRNLVGHGARHMIEQSFTGQGRTLDTATTDRLFRDFIDHYGQNIAVHSRPYPGMESALDHLTTRDHRFAVCTNKPEGLSLQLLDTLNLSWRFHAICGADTFSVRKPHPDALLQTIERAGGTPSHAIMVGDSQTDIATARAAEIPVIAVDFGYTELPIAHHNPDRIISSFDALPAAINELLRDRA